MSTNQELQRIKENLSPITPEIMESIITTGDLSGLSKTEMVLYYQHYCVSLGLNPTTKPFIVISMKGDQPNTTKKVLYPGREASAQLSMVHNVSHALSNRRTENGCYFVDCRATMPNGRFSDTTGAVPVTFDNKAGNPIAPLYGESYCNAIKKAETQAKRRATLDIVGLGMLDAETEVEDGLRRDIDIPAPAATAIALSHEAPPKKLTKKELKDLAKITIANMANCKTLEDLDILLQNNEEVGKMADVLEQYTAIRNVLKGESVLSYKEAVDVTDIVSPQPVIDELDTPLIGVSAGPDQDIRDAIANVQTEQERLAYMNSIHPVHNVKIVDYIKNKGGELLEYAKQRRAELNPPTAAPAQPQAAAPTTRRL